MADILTRRQTHFVLWCPKEPVHLPELILGEIQNGNPPTFKQLIRKTLNKASGDVGAHFRPIRSGRQRFGAHGRQGVLLLVRGR